VYRYYFHQFISVGSEILYPLYVSLPVSEEELRSHTQEFKLAGFSGCIGSTDATHIAEKCSYHLRNNHLGAKQHITSSTFNLTVNHRRRILSTTSGMPGRWDDKTVVLFDGFVNGIHKGQIHNNAKFNLFEYVPAGNIVLKEYTGSWFIVDNGYLKWSTTVPPLKVTALEKERQWSHWLESLRKDVECTFGILKGRWRILKTGIRLQGVEVANKIWRTCCALQNMLLEVDGLDGEWEGNIGMLDSNDVINNVPFAIERLNEGWNPQIFDASGLGPGDDRTDCSVAMETNHIQHWVLFVYDCTFPPSSFPCPE
jgi:hypothetical protein